jgi:hypothetical protein
MTSGGKTVRCDNCGNVAGPRFCPHCGQETETRQGPLVEAGREVFSDVLSLDSRLLRTLRALLRPGHLSVLYLRGKRAPFLRPFRLYLVASLVLFSTILALETPDASSDLNIFIGGELVGPASAGSVTKSLQFLKDDTTLGRWMIKISGVRIDRLRALPRQELLDVLFSGLRRMLPLSLILFVPFLALALKLLYIRRRTARSLYLDHLVFSLHFQAALFFALALAWLVTTGLGLNVVGSGIAYAVTALVMLLSYLPVALRRFYDQSPVWTAVKTIVLLFVYVRLLGVAVSLSVLVAIWNV